MKFTSSHLLLSVAAFSIAISGPASAQSNDVPPALPPSQTYLYGSEDPKESAAAIDEMQGQETRIIAVLLTPSNALVDADINENAVFSLSERNEANETNLTIECGFGTDAGNKILLQLRNELGAFDEIQCKSQFRLGQSVCVGFTANDQSFFEIFIGYYGDGIQRVEFRHFTPEEWSRFDHINPRRSGKNG